MRIVFWGTPAPAVPALATLLADPDTEVVAVVTNPDRPAGRGHRLRPSPVKAAAVEAGVRTIWQPHKPAEVRDELVALAPAACAVVAYGALLPAPLLAAGGAGFVNLHFSLLPAWRGAAPVPHSILAGDTETGVSCFVLEAGMDTGPVLNSRSTRIRPAETAGELTARLADLGAPLLRDAVHGLVDGTLEPVPQDHARATFAPKIAPDDARIDWQRTAERLDRQVRAFNPVPGAHTTFDGARLKVHRATPLPTGVAAPRSGGQAAPGLVVELDGGRPVVACGEGLLRLDEVQPAGKARMDGHAFANGYRPVGTRLGVTA